MQRDITIIGAGLTGLTIAHRLQQAGKKVALVEKAPYAGGVIQTRLKNGFVYETGPNTGVLSTPELVQLFDDLEGFCSLEKAHPKGKKRWIWKKGRWHALPSGLLSGVTTPLFTMKDKVRLLGEPFRKPGTDPDETLDRLVLRRMGKSFLDYAVDPFISGIYAGNPRTLVPRYALPKLYRLEQEYGSFIRGAVKKRKKPKSELEKRATRDVFSVEGGLQRLVDAMVSAIGKVNIVTGCEETHIEKEGNRYRTVTRTDGSDRVIESGTVVTTTGSYTLRTLLPFVDPREWDAIENLHYAPIVMAAAGFNPWHGIQLDAFGGLIPTVEDRQSLGILFPSGIFRSRTPAGGALLSVFMGGMKRPGMIEKSNAELEEIVINEIRQTMGLRDPRPDLLEIYRYPHAIPQYESDSPRRLEAIDRIEKNHPGLYLAGNIRDGIGMADRVKQGFAIAESITQA